MRGINKIQGNWCQYRILELCRYKSEYTLADRLALDKDNFPHKIYPNRAILERDGTLLDAHWFQDKRNNRSSRHGQKITTQKGVGKGSVNGIGIFCETPAGH